MARVKDTGSDEPVPVDPVDVDPVDVASESDSAVTLTPETRVETVPDEVNQLGDQDADNTSTPAYPAHAYEPTPENIRRYPELHLDTESEA